MKRLVRPFSKPAFASIFVSVFPFIFALIFFFCATGPSTALAESSAIDPSALAALQAAHPGYALTSPTQWGDTAAAVLSAGDVNVLCVAEKQGGAWVVTIDNPTALRRGERLPSLLLDTDTALFWRYNDGDGDTVWYDAVRDNGVWGNVSVRYSYSHSNGITERLVHLTDMGWAWVLVKRNCYEDVNENILYETVDLPIPADWLAAYASLATFDAELFPSAWMWTHDWTNERAREGAAKQLLPEYAYRGGIIHEDDMQFLLERPDGALVFVCVSYTESSGWSLTESAPLPAGTDYGYDNFSDSLFLPQGVLANVKRYGSGQWGLDYLYGTPGGVGPDEMICFGENWIADSTYTPDRRYFGDHPWSDVTTIDWATLPTSLDDALRRLDRSAWATVNNPDPKDRLHLRAAPQREAPSLGKYYSGTPVRVLEDVGDWLRVSVYGVEGFMMRAYLAFGDAMNDVAPAGPMLCQRESTLILRRTPDETGRLAAVHDSTGLDLRVIGVVGDEWYHVWLVGSGLSGYVKQSELWPGNG